MKLMIAIMLSTIVGYLLLLMGPFFGGLLAFGIVLGILLRGLVLLKEIHKALVVNEHKTALDNYLEERDRKENAAHLKG